MMIQISIVSLCLEHKELHKHPSTQNMGILASRLAILKQQSLLSTGSIDQPKPTNSIQTELHVLA